MNYWILIKTLENKWFLGKLSEYDPKERKMKILALTNRKFYYIEKYQDSIVEAWVVEKWINLKSKNHSNLTF
ncbi:hypothetical protein [Clostridium grantii]|uniref:Uncharacterized protein n=1 Tax=Clostridium grantii DSM 8605 TaxID=1121316 RepID=A0A1M5W2D9_9CLOT|nr:hypothetical protein [Clostridium grantii]SHH81607.1 hypothetical protein SAMN02745207_02639 [Clostridium grantii DSM 8605]